MKAKDIIKKCHDYVTVIDDEQTVDTCWGIGSVYVTSEQIKQLLDGKNLYFSDGEYAHIICLKN